MESTSQPMASTLVATATAYMQLFKTLDPDTVTSLQSEDYTHVFAPASLNPPPAMNREAFATHISSLQGVLRSFPVSLKEVWPNPSLNQVVIWAASETHFHDHVKDNDNEEEWRFRGEYMWVLTMDKSGKKIKHVLEFLDSKGVETLQGLFGRAFKKLAESTGNGQKGLEGGWGD